METRDELSNTCNSKVMSRCLSAPDATSLPTEPSLILYYLKVNSVLLIYTTNARRRATNVSLILIYRTIAGKEGN